MIKIKTKLCPDCLVSKETDFFYKRVGSRDGLHTYCKSCHNKRNKTSSRKWQQSARGKQWISNHNKEYRESHKNEFREYNRVYARKYQSSPKGLEQRRIIDKRKRENPTFRLNSNMSRVLRKSLENGKQGRSWLMLVDYSLEDLKLHLQRQFTKEMTWENYGTYWHIDHIKPRSYFIYKSQDDSQFKECWSLSNLQPLEAVENIRKSNKLIYATSGQ